MTCHRLGSLLALVSLGTLGTLAIPAPGRAQPTARDTVLPAATSPLALRASRTLANGLRAHVVHLPSAATMAILVTVPVGSAQDPPGLGTLAHFAEHLQFSDHRGRTTAEIEREIAVRGGRTNASTGPDRTTYYLSIGREHRDFAIRWLAWILEPKALSPAVVERERLPVVVEERLRPWTALDHLRDRVGFPAWAVPADDWERVLGIRRPPRWTEDRFAANARIGAPEVRAFHARHYVPTRMSLVVVSDGSPSAVYAALDSTFGRLATEGPTPPPPVPGARRPGPRAFTGWHLSPVVSLHERFAFAPRTPRDDVRLGFLARFLAEQLNEDLRFGNEKAAYGVSVGIARRFGAAWFGIRAGLVPTELSRARSVMEARLAALADGTLPDSTYRRLRDQVVQTTRTQLLDPERFVFWYGSRGAEDPARHPELPDVVGDFAAMPQAEVQVLAASLFVPPARLRTVVRPLPLPLLVIVLALVGTAVAAWFATRRAGLRPLPMRRLRYVARMRWGPVQLVVARVLLPALIALALWMLCLIVVRRGSDALMRLDAFPAVAALALCVAAALGAIVARVQGWFPTRLMVFEDGIAIRAGTRVRWIAAADLVAARAATWRETRDRGEGRRTIRLALGHRSPALWLQVRDRPDWFFGVRDAREAAEVVTGVIGAAGPAPHDGPEPVRYADGTRTRPAATSARTDSITASTDA